MAVNENGIGAPLEGLNPTKAKAPYGNYSVFLIYCDLKLQIGFCLIFIKLFFK